MISAKTDSNGLRTYWVPKALADVAMELFGDDIMAAVFRLARVVTWADCHTAEQIALEGRHAEAVDFVRKRMVKPSSL